MTCKRSKNSLAEVEEKNVHVGLPTGVGSWDMPVPPGEVSLIVAGPQEVTIKSARMVGWMDTRMEFSRGGDPNLGFSP